MKKGKKNEPVIMRMKFVGSGGNVEGESQCEFTCLQSAFSELGINAGLEMLHPDSNCDIAFTIYGLKDELLLGGVIITSGLTDIPVIERRVKNEEY